MRWFAGPLALAVIVTLVNAIKPVLIDDTAYLIFARHLAHQPLDPYGFTIHWYTMPDRGMEVLLPPVLPYWLALGIAIFGEHIFVLKLWLFPFLFCFTKSLDVLLRRFARGTVRIALPVIVLSPAVLPTVNLMLDIPAAALGLAAVAMFTQRRLSWKQAALAGLIAGFAMQTKYTAMLAPAVIAWYGLTHRRIRLAILACGLAAGVFAGWESLLQMKYGESHFLFHLEDQRKSAGNFVAAKLALVPGLLGHLGLLGFGFALFAARPLGVPNRFIIGIAAVWTLGAILVCTVDSGSLRARNVWRPAGAAVMIAAAACVIALVLKLSWPRVSNLRASVRPVDSESNRQPTDPQVENPRPRKSRLRFSRDSWFIAGWLMLELAGYFALTPFPAARRVIGFAIVFGILAARVVKLIPSRKPPGWIAAFTIWIGLLSAGLDTFDASPEKVLAERAAKELKNEKRVWFAGRWGFQFYCERAGFTTIVPGETVLQPGDVLVLPIHPDREGFHRPYMGWIPIRPPKDRVRVLERYVFPAGFPAQTVPNLYGGNDPIDNAIGPVRLEVVVYRVLKPWKVAGK